MRVKLSVWAKQNGISFKTAQRWYYAGKMPVPTTKTPTGRIMVCVDEPESPGRTVLYGRVASSDQKGDLVRQIERLRMFAASRGLLNVEIIEEIGSGLNGKRTRLLRLLSDPAVRTIIVEHRDRLGRFGVEYIEAALAAHGRKLLMLEAGEQKLE